MINFLHGTIGSVVTKLGEKQRELLRQFVEGQLPEQPLQMITGTGSITADPSSKLCNSLVRGTLIAGPNSILLDTVVAFGGRLELGENCIAVGLSVDGGAVVRLENGSAWIGGKAQSIADVTLSDGAVFEGVSVSRESGLETSRIRASGARVFSTALTDLHAITLDKGCIIMGAKFSGSGVEFGENSVVAPYGTVVESMVCDTLDKLEYQFMGGTGYGTCPRRITFNVTGCNDANHTLLSIGRGSVLRASVRLALSRYSRIGANFRLARPEADVAMRVSAGELDIGPDVTWIASGTSTLSNFTEICGSKPAAGSLYVQAGTCVIQEAQGVDCTYARITSVPGQKLIL